MKLHCETCGKDVPEVLCPTCAKWWHDNPPELEARATAAEAENARLREVLQALDLEIEKHGFSSTGVMRRMIADAIEAQQDKEPT